MGTDIPSHGRAGTTCSASREPTARAAGRRTCGRAARWGLGVLNECPNDLRSCAVSTRLQTARLVIRPLDRSDAEAWIAMVSDPEVRRFLPPGPDPTMETFERGIESRHAMERELGYAMWAVEDRTTGTFMGQCGIRPAKSMDEDAGSEIDLA